MLFQVLYLFELLLGAHQLVDCVGWIQPLVSAVRRLRLPIFFTFVLLLFSILQLRLVQQLLYDNLLYNFDWGLRTVLDRRQWFTRNWGGWLGRSHFFHDLGYVLVKWRCVDWILELPVVQRRYQESKVFFMRDIQMSVDEVLLRKLFDLFRSFCTWLYFCIDLLFNRLIGRLLDHFLIPDLFSFLRFVR